MASCVLTPLGLWTGYLAHKAPREGLHAFDISGFVAGCLAALAFITFFRWMNRRLTARGEFFSLDKIQEDLGVAPPGRPPP